MQSLPLDRVVTDTDGPFIEDAERPIAPGDVRTALQRLASTLAIRGDEIHALVVSNLVDLVSGRARGLPELTPSGSSNTGNAAAGG